MKRMDVDEKDKDQFMKTMISLLKELQINSNYEKGLVPIQKNLSLNQLKLTKNLILLHQTIQTQTFTWYTPIRSVKKWKLWCASLSVNPLTSVMWTLYSDLPTGNDRQAQIDGNPVPLIWTQPIARPS